MIGRVFREQVSSKQALVRQLRDYLHQVCHALGFSTRLVPHQLRHTYASEMIRSGVSFPALMTLLDHTSSDMTMRYVEVALTDLRREFDLARSQPRHLVPQPKTTGASLRAGLDGVIDALLKHVLEMFRRALPVGASRTSLARLSNRLSKSSPKHAHSPHPKIGHRLAGHVGYSQGTFSRTTTQPHESGRLACLSIRKFWGLLCRIIVRDAMCNHDCRVRP